MSSIYDWSLLAASNANSDDNINWQEGQPPSTVNNSARSMMQRVRELISDLGAVTATTGTANIISFAAKSSFSSYVDGIRLAFRASNTNTGPSTLNVNSIGPKSIFSISNRIGVTSLSSGNITANGIYEVIYSSALDSGSGGWILLNPTIQIKPVGSLEIMAAPVVPSGYLYCNGQAVSRSTYSALFNFLGTGWGAGDGSTTFNVPDYRGMFMRGWDDGRGVDSGRGFTTLQNSQNRAHSHTYSGNTTASGEHVHSNFSTRGNSQGAGNYVAPSNGAGGDFLLFGTTGSAGNHFHSYSGTTSGEGGTESRPINLNVFIVVKF